MFAGRNSAGVTVSLVIETTPSLEESLEASALTHASRRGLLARRSPLLKLQGDAKLIAMARSGNPGAFETIVDRYQGRLLGFCRQMLGSTEDAEDVLQEVFVNAYRAMLADEREINLRPWLYRIARNRCLNHLRKPTADAQESMDMVPAVEASSTAERAHNREEFRQLLTDVNKLPETQRSALLLREMDALSYEEIADGDGHHGALGQVAAGAGADLARRGEPGPPADLRRGPGRALRSGRGPAQGLRPGSPPRPRVRRVRRLPLPGPLQREGAGGPLPGRRRWSRSRASSPPSSASAGLAAALGPLARRGGAGVAGAARPAGAAGAGAVGSVGAALGGGSAAGGIGAIGGAIGTKAVAGVVTAAVITAGVGAVEVKQNAGGPIDHGAKISRQANPPHAPALAPAQVSEPQIATVEPEAAPPPAEPAAEPTPQDPQAEPAPEAAPVTGGEDAGQPSAGEGAVGTGGPTGEGITVASPPAGATAGAHGSGGGVVVVTVGGSAVAPLPRPPPAHPPNPRPLPLRLQRPNRRLRPARRPPPAPAPAPPKAKAPCPPLRIPKPKPLHPRTEPELPGDRGRPSARRYPRPMTLSRRIRQVPANWRVSSSE